ncbi:MAG: NAD(P)/FAD-dependent oxidoreductase [Theionarchaea archaeon]|nr:NAD(P)/FAD-dependent oxidoreductase [Theionarchaea archaeon]MBU7020671.1 NAD(P)/FAD-dependent oxidoreductase [Theionarchaea archaeon]
MDVVIIGAGPAGTMAARVVAEQGFTVTVYEKGPLKREKPCGGAVSGRVLREFDFKASNQFWDRPCTGIFLCSPRNKTATLPSDRTMAYFVMREKFDYYLAREAQSAGASLVENAPAEPLVKNGKVVGVRVNDEEIRAAIVIACDGTPSSCARALNLYRGNDSNQAATYQYQMSMDNTEIDEKIGNNLEIYFGSSWVPYGYSWIFPKDGIVTVGCGTWFRAFKHYTITMKQCLDRFIKDHPVAGEKVKNAHVLYPQSAMIGFSGISSPIYRDGFMIAGDAAGFVSLPTGEGIYYSMVSGKIAGEVAVEALRKEDFSKGMLKKYKERTDQRIGADMKWGPWLRRLALDTERDQEHVVKISAKDRWFGTMVRDMIVGDIPYNMFLWNLVKRPHKIGKFWLGI